jgi:hypothetical protein
MWVGKWVINTAFAIDAMFSAGAFGPKLSGKTTLVKQLSRQYYSQRSMRSLVLDPNLDGDWGPQAWVTNDREAFFSVVWKSRNCLVIMEEAAASINRDREMVPMFTRLRHLEHRLIVVGHSGADLLPTMRQQFDTLYLFRQPASAGEVWAEVFADERIMECTRLKQYEILHCELFKDPRKIILAGPGVK